MGETISIGIFKEDKNCINPEDIKLKNLVFSLCSRSLRLHSQHIHTHADPFLFEEKGQLYLFAEIQATGENGYINCWQYQEDSNWTNIGPVLKDVCHYSYPFIFRDEQDQVYMIPESGQTKEISLWKFYDFPLGLTKEKKILSGCYYDSNILFHNGCYYLFTTNTKEEFLIFFSDKLLSDNWMPHPENPITSNKKISRNGGGVVCYNNSLIRIAQNCSKKYGEGIVILNVLRLDRMHYEEEIITDNFKPEQNYVWQKNGRHHLSFCNFKSGTFIAMDGFGNDLTVNKFINGMYKLLNK